MIGLTEIDKIREATLIYEGEKYATHDRWEDAKQYLLKVYQAYGTIDINLINDILR